MFKKGNLLLWIVLIFLIFNINFSYSQKTIYLDPSSTSATQDGSITNPYKSFDMIDNVRNSFASGNTYAVKRGTIMRVTKSIFVRPGKITIRAYGSGPRPTIISSVSPKQKILDVSLSSNFTIRDIELMAADTALTVINIQGSPNTSIINCRLHEAYYGLRNIDSRNKVYVDSVEIFNIVEDGVYFNGADSVIIKNSYVHHVNQAWFKDPTEKGSYGDAIQLDAAKYFYIGNNILDRSDTGNKFCFITGSGPCPGSVFEKNKSYGSQTLGAHMYNINTDGLIIRYNLFEGGARSIYGSGLNTKVYYNIFNNISDCVFGQITRSNQEFYNNVFANCNKILSSWSDKLYVKNNIFYKINDPFEGNYLYEDHNIYYESGGGGLLSSVISLLSKVVDPLFVDASNGNFNLKEGSPALNSGEGLDIPKRDYIGTTFSSSESASIGAYQKVSQGTTVSIPQPVGQSVVCNSASAVYTTTGVEQGNAYAWKLSPTEAGTLTTKGKMVSIAWSSAFTGIASLSYNVTGNNNFSGSSPKLDISVTGSPTAPNKPSGTSTLNQGAQVVTYNTTSVTNASSYNWSINPPSAGNFDGTTNNTNLSLAGSFSGTANISVQSVNSSCASSWSSPLTITVNQTTTTTLPRPSGETKPCQNTSLTYTTTGVTQATTYNWKLSPSNAGTLTSNGKSVSISWSNTFTGSVSLSYDVTGSNNYSGTSPTLAITVSGAPTTPNKPTGTSTLNKGAKAVTYNTNSIGNATSYNWSINPSTAGSFTGTTNSASLTLSSTFTGAANISVRAVSSCGTSSWSTPLAITVNSSSAPGMPRPIGNLNPCQGTQVIYTTQAASQNYTWKVNPSNAGTVISNGKSAAIIWSKQYTGNVMVYYEISGTSGINTSQQLQVEVGALPPKPGKPEGDDLLIQGEQTVTYSTGGSATNVSEYLWTINPDNAGTLSTQENFANLYLNKDYYGNIVLSVKAKNLCGLSDDSEPLTIVVKDKHSNIPTFFSPNGDGKDDMWNIPLLAEYPNAKVKIFDISGRIVKIFPGYESGWDGYIGGRLADIGVYVFVIDLKDGSDIITGKILLMR